MDVKRRLDYVLASECFLIKESGPPGILNLGSDHRVVRTVLTIQKRTKKRYEKKAQMKKRRPILDPDGNSSRYHEALRGKLELHQDTRMESMEKVLYERLYLQVYESRLRMNGNRGNPKKIRNLFETELCNNPVGRSIISKNIQKRHGQFCASIRIKKLQSDCKSLLD